MNPEEVFAMLAAAEPALISILNKEVPAVAEAVKAGWDTVVAFLEARAVTTKQAVADIDAAADAALAAKFADGS